MNAEIRRAREGDETALAYIQTESWKAAFRDILDAATLDRCTDPDRAAAMYHRLLTEKKGNGYLLLLDGNPQLIAWWDAARDEELRGKAELICIHSLPSVWRQGCGRRMMERLLADMRAAGFAEAVLWVFRDNQRARAFYEALGFREAGLEKPGLGAEEILYAKTL